MRRKADLCEYLTRRVSAGRLARHGEKQPASLFIEQQDGASLRFEQLAYTPRREAEQWVQVGERRDGARNVVEQLQTVGTQAH